MNTRRLAGLAALGVAAASVLVLPGAGAQETSFSATSDAQALGLDLFGQQLTAGLAHSEVSSAPKAAAAGTGLANPLSPAGATTATVETADGADGKADETCEGDIALPEQIDILSIDLACSASLAAIEGGAPGSASTARVGTVVADPVSLLVGTPLEEIITQVQAGTDQVTEGLQPLLGPIGENTGLMVDTFLDDVTDSLNVAPLLSLTLGTSSTATSVTPTSVTAECLASGGRLDILDAPPVSTAAGTVDPPPVISVIIGDAASTVSVDTASGTGAPTVNPSLVTVVVPSLGIEQAVAVGDPIEIPLPEPIGTSVITVAGGSTGTDAEGRTFARASAVRLDLLNGEALQGGIELSLADCLTVAGATPAAAPVSDPPAEPAQPLPRTGGTAPDGLALAVVIGAAGLGVTLLRRTRIA